jgi:succinoglycan biosynthesis protein ExoA
MMHELSTCSSALNELETLAIMSNITRSSSKSEPALSVVVPCRNEKHHIESVIQSILSQESPPGAFEVIVADGMSDDGTREILEEIARGDPRLKVVDNNERITPSGMNVGIRHARGQFIAIMGAHNEYASDYLRASVEILEETGADNVGGSMVCRGQSRMQQAIAIAHHSPFSVGGAHWHNTSYEGPADTVFGGVYRREVFDRIGLFDESFVRNQDDELNLRLTRAGGKIWHSPRIRSWYHPRASLTALFRQYVQYGYWKVRVMQKHRRPAALRHIIPGGFVFSLIALPLLAMFYQRLLFVWLGLIGVYLLSNISASLVTAAQHGWKYLPLLPPVFACYHFGYGLGFMRGILDFIILRRSPSTAFTSLTRPSATSVHGSE